MFLVEHPTMFITVVIGTINSAKPFLNFIDVISIYFQNSVLDLNLFCIKVCRNLNFIVT